MNRLDRLAWRRSMWMLLALAALNALYWLLYAHAPAFHAHWMRGEDRLIEWITFTGFAGAGLLCLLLVRRGGGRWHCAWLLGLALFFLVCAGEEISWGQRLLGFATPEQVSERNEQNEFNLHNLDLEHISPLAIVSWCLKCFGIVGPLLIAWRRRGERDPWRAFFPSPGVVPLFVAAEFLTAARGRLAPWLHAQFGETVAQVVKLDTMEFKEMVWGVSVLLAALALRDRFRHAKE